MGTLAVSVSLLALAISDVNPTADEALRTAKEIHVATQRKDGSWSKTAPVWFMYTDAAIYFSTKASSYKARRLRDGGPVRVSVGGPDGPTFEGRGSLVTDPALIDRMASHYRQKYWIAWMGLFVPNKGRVAAGKTVIVKVVAATAP